MDLRDVIHPGMSIFKIQDAPSERPGNYDIQSTANGDAGAVLRGFDRVIAALGIVRQGSASVVPFDFNAKKPLRRKNLGSSSRDYHRFSFCFRDVLLANSETLAAARIADVRKSPTDLKLLDKILFQLGIHMN